MESLKTSLAKSLDMEMPLKEVTHDLVSFLETNISKYPGNAGLKFKVIDFEEQASISLYTLDKGVSLNDELIDYLNSHPDIHVQVGLTG